MRSVLALSCLGLLVTACEPRSPGQAAAPPAETNLPAAPAPLAPVQGFSHEVGADLFGYYFPTTEVQIGSLKLSHLFIGAEEDLAAWEASGGRGQGSFAPLMLQFDDLSSETIANELGGQGYTVTVRVLPDGYGVSRQVLRFAGQHERLGFVTFEGRFLEPAFGQARAGGPVGDPVLNGVLTIDGRIYEGQSFVWTAGD